MYYERLMQGKKTVFLHPREFIAKAAEYFKWSEEHPLLEDKVFNLKDDGITHEPIAKVRAFTKKGLAGYLGLPSSFLGGLRVRGKDWEEAVEMVEEAIYNQKFENAAAGLLNGAFIARDLEMADKHELGGIEGAPPVSLELAPIQSGTFLPPEEEAEQESPVEP